MKILAIDPGTEQSAWLFYDADDNLVLSRDITPNDDVLAAIAHYHPIDDDLLAVEMIASYGMPVGKDVFGTCVWIGRFLQAWTGPHQLIYRRDVKLHLCNSARAKDSNVRQALLDRFGPGKQKATGLKKTPGPLYGIKKDLWAALGVAVTCADNLRAALAAKEKDAT